MFKYTLEGLCSSLEIHSVNVDPSMVRIKLSPTSEGLFTRQELEAMIHLLGAVLKDETP
jgi:hypothetical protein